MNESKESERKIAREEGGYRQPGSGNKQFPGLRADVRVPRVRRIEQKDPRTRKYVLKARDLDGLWRLAQQASEMPVFYIITRRWNDFAIIDGEDLREKALSGYIDVFNKMKEIEVRRQKTLYLDELDDLLFHPKPDWVRYVKIITPERAYALLYRDQFNLVWSA